MKYETLTKLILKTKEESLLSKFKYKMFNLVYLLSLDYHSNATIEIISIVFQTLQLLSFPINEKVTNTNI